MVQKLSAEAAVETERAVNVANETSALNLASEIAPREEKISQLQANLADYKSLSESLSQQLDKRKMAVSQLTSDIATLRNDLNASEALRVADATASEALQAALKDTIADVRQSSEAEITKVLERAATLKKALNETREEIEHLKEAHESDSKIAAGELAAVRKAAMDAAEEAKCTIDDLNTQLQRSKAEAAQLKEEADAELSRTVSLMTSELEASKFAGAEQIAKLKDEFSTFRAQKDGEIVQIQHKHSQALNRLKAEQEQAADAADATRAVLEQQLEEVVKDFADHRIQSEEQFGTMTADLDECKLALQKEQEAAAQNAQAAASEISQLKEEARHIKVAAEYDLASATESHAEEVARLKSAEEAARDELVKRNEAELVELNAQWEQSQQALVAKHSSDIDTIKQEAAAQAKQLEAKFETEIAKLKAALEEQSSEAARAAREAATQLDNMATTHEREVAEAKAAGAQALEALESQHLATTMNAENAWKTRMAEVRSMVVIDFCDTMVTAMCACPRL